MSDAAELGDLRSKPMETRDGYGLAAGKWDAAASALVRGGLIEVGARRVALEDIQSLVGFWALWQLEGGFAGMERIGYAPATIYRKIKSFREVFGQHPDQFSFPGLIADPAAYLEFMGIDASDERAGNFPRVLKDARTGPARLRRKNRPTT
jgi:hypothetical protein